MAPTPRLWSVNNRFSFLGGYGLVLPGLPKKAFLLTLSGGDYVSTVGDIPDSAELITDTRELSTTVRVALDAAAATAQYIP